MESVAPSPILLLFCFVSFHSFGNYYDDHFPLYLGRSHVAIHAGDVIRGLHFLLSRPDTGSLPLRVFAENNVHSAVLHAFAGASLRRCCFAGGVACHETPRRCCACVCLVSQRCMLPRTQLSCRMW